MPFTIIDGGSFTSAGVGVRISVPSSADYFVTKNITKLSAAAPTGCIMGEWFGSKFGSGQTANNDGIRWRKAGSAAVLVDSFATATASNGFTYVTDSPFVEAQAANAITNISLADPAVVTQTNTYVENDIIRIYNTTGMLQIAGMPFQISTVTSSNYELLGLDASGFAAVATAGNTRRLSPTQAVDPEFLYITAISQATSAVIRTSVDPTNFYAAGMKIRLSVPAAFGMSEIDGLEGVITATSSAAYTLTVDIDSSTFTAFSFPTSANAQSSQRFATLAPAGASTTENQITSAQTGYNFTLQPFRTGQFTPYMYLAAGASSPAGASNDVINYAFYKYET